MVELYFRGGQKRVSNVRSNCSDSIILVYVVQHYSYVVVNNYYSDTYIVIT